MSFEPETLPLRKLKHSEENSPESYDYICSPISVCSHIHCIPPVANCKNGHKLFSFLNPCHCYVIMQLLYQEVESISLSFESGLGHMVCFSQKDISQCDANRGLRNICTLGFAFPCWARQSETTMWTNSSKPPSRVVAMWKTTEALWLTADCQIYEWCMRAKWWSWSPNF